MTNESVTTGSTGTESADKKLVFELIQSMYTGLALMGQAQTKVLAQDVTELAKKLQKQHMLLTEELKMYASKQGWLIPTGELEEDIAMREEMAGKHGEEYQQQWLAVLKERHEANIHKLEQAHPADPKLKKMCEKSLSKLKDLVNDIVDVQQAVV